MCVYFNNNSFLWGKALKDCSAGLWVAEAVEPAKSRAQARLRAQLRLSCAHGRHWHCPVSTSQAMPCSLIPAMFSPAPCQCQWHLMPVFLIFLFILNYKLSPGLLAIINSIVQRGARAAPQLSLGFQTHPASQSFGWVWTPLLFSLFNPEYYSWTSEPASKAYPSYFWSTQFMRGVLKFYSEKGKFPKEMEVRFAVQEHPKSLDISLKFF